MENFKSLKLIILIASAVIAVSAAICSVVIFWEEITKFFCALKQYCTKQTCSGSEEYADFADV